MEAPKPAMTTSAQPQAVQMSMSSSIVDGGVAKSQDTDYLFPPFRHDEPSRSSTSTSRGAQEGFGCTVARRRSCQGLSRYARLVPIASYHVCLQDCFLGAFECFLCFGMCSPFGLAGLLADHHPRSRRVLQGNARLSSHDIFRPINNLFSQDCCECFADIICTSSISSCLDSSAHTCLSRLPLRDVLLDDELYRTLCGLSRCIYILDSYDKRDYAYSPLGHWLQNICEIRCVLKQTVRSEFLTSLCTTLL